MIRRLPAVSVVLAFITLFGCATTRAQFAVRPVAGIETIVFNGDNQARRPISPGNDINASFGGGLTSANNAVHLGVELVPDPLGVLRFPVSAEYYWFDGKTTFYVPSDDGRIRQLRLHYMANMLSVGTGIKASFFNGEKATLYFSGEGRFNYIPATKVTSRQYFLDTGEPATQEQSYVPSGALSRFGAVLKIGTQADFFDPVLLDFSIGYGAVNLAGKNTDVNTQRDILVAEPTLTSTERTLGFVCVGLTVIWTL